MTTFDEFTQNYMSGDAASRVVLDLTVPETHGSELSPFIVLRYGNRTMVLNPMALPAYEDRESHLCVDVHSFVDGDEARAGAFGMERGARAQFPLNEVKGTSHGWPGALLVSVLLGHQADVVKAHLVTLTITNQNTGETFTEVVEDKHAALRRQEFYSNRSTSSNKGWRIRSCVPPVPGIATDADPAGDVFFVDDK